MKIKKINYNFSVDQIIENSLSIQSIQKNLKDKFGISNPSLTIFKNPNFIKSYKDWNDDKKHLFIKTIGGVVYYGKIKKYLSEIVENNGEKI